MRMKEIAVRGIPGVPLGSPKTYHLSELDLVFDQSLDKLSVVLEVNVIWKHAKNDVNNNY